MEFHFVHFADPKPCERARSGKGKVYTSAGYRQYKRDLVKTIREEMAGKNIFPMTGKLAGIMIFDRRTAVRTDLDNLAKAVMDALQDAGAIKDDHQFYELTIKKIIRAAVPKTIVHVKELGA